MTQKWLLAFLVVVSFVLASVVASAQTFHSPTGYSITAPAGWALKKKPDTKSEIFIVSKLEPIFSINLNVRSIALPNSITLAQLQTELKTSYAKQFPGYKFVSEKYTTVGGQRAYELIFDHTQGGNLIPLWARQDAVIRDGKLYFFTCTALSSNAYRYASGFNAILKSVHWTGK